MTWAAGVGVAVSAGRTVGTGLVGAGEGEAAGGGAGVEYDTGAALGEAVAARVAAMRRGVGVAGAPPALFPHPASASAAKQISDTDV